MTKKKSIVSEIDVEKVIRFLTSNGAEKLRCPRCGWQEGKAWHCGLCEGHEEDVVAWYKNNLNAKEPTVPVDYDKILYELLKEFKHPNIAYPNGVVMADSHYVNEQVLRLIYNFFLPYLQPQQSISEGDLREMYIDLLTSELRWHQDADNKSMGVTDDQKKWFCEGIIQSIYLIMGNYSRKSFEQLKEYLTQPTKEQEKE